MNNAEHFFKTYGGFFSGGQTVKVMEIGSQDQNGSMRAVCPPAFEYIGVDAVAVKGVDVVLEDACALAFASESLDMNAPLSSFH